MEVDGVVVVAGSSLFLTRSEKAHREHQRQHQQHKQYKKQQQQQQHKGFHKLKRQTETQIDVQQVVTEVVQTVSYIQQVDVDSNGSTIAIQTVLADSTGGIAVPTTGASSAATTTTTDPASPGITNTASAAPSTIVAPLQPDSSTIQSLPSNSSTTSTSTSTSTSSSASSIPTSSFALLSVSSNSTTLISSTTSQIRTFANSTITSSTSVSSSFTYLISSSSTSSEVSSSYVPSSSSSVYESYSTSESNATPTVGGGGGFGAGTGATTASTSSSTAASGNETSSGSSSTVSTGSVVGGVVGGVAGAAILIFFLMAFLRWKKRHQNMLLLGSGDARSGGNLSRGIEGPPSTQPAGGMAGPRSSIFSVPASLVSLTGFKRASNQTVSTEPEGERGFYRVSGRKLTSVLQTGGDGFGDGDGEGIVDNTLSGSSFYRDSQGFYGGSGPGSPTLSAPFHSQRPESGIPVMRPSPARTPVQENGPFAFGPVPLTPPTRPDMVGRSHPSQDGSHASRFTEEV